ncbi:MAG: hypothetical protein M3Y65_03300 [Pseudomonadota bacterium]|nr:hypothetical protein [Pseudomonadota bacterium]
MHALHAVLVLSLLSMSPGVHADPRQSSSSSSSKSFKGGFSSQRSSAPPPRAPRQDSASRGGFGSFNSAPSRNTQKSDSALSQRLDRNASEANALRTLDARRAAQEQAARDTRPVPGYENRQGSNQNSGQYNAPMPMPAPAPVQRSDNGMAGVVTGMVLGQIANGAHARSNNGYQGQSNVGTSSATVNQTPAGGSFFGGVAKMFMWLMILSAIAWVGWFLLRKRRRKTAENQPNYTFEGQ